MRTGEQNPVIHVDRAVREMLVQITAYRVGAIAVVGSQGELKGLVTDYDIRKALESDRSILDMTISEIMNAEPATISEETMAVEALERMRRRDKPTAVLPVVDTDKRAVGMIHLHDLIAAGL